MQIAVARRSPIMRRAAVAGKLLARERLVHHAEHRLAEAHQADQRAPGHHAGDEGFGAVDRIEHPDIFGVGALGAVFLAENAVAGKILADERAHRLLGGAVGRGDRIETAGLLVIDRQRRAEKRQDGLARHAGELIDETAEIDGRHRPLLIARSPKVAPGFPERSCGASSSRVRHSIFSAIKQCKSHWVRLPRLTEIVMFLPPGSENCEICPSNPVSSYALKHGIFDCGP